MKWIRFISILCCLIVSFVSAQAQRSICLDLEETIRMANDSSLMAFRNENMYLSGYWEYRTYKAERLPSLSLDLVPSQYYRYITERYDSNLDHDVFRQQQMFSASGGLVMKQNFDLTGGTFYVESYMEYMRNFGNDKLTQFSSIPFRIGYSQDLMGFNPFRWDKKIEPLKFEKVKREFLYNSEQVAEEAVASFFNLAMAQAEYQLAADNMASSDTLYQIGKQRQKIAAISKADMLTLQLDYVNARNTLENKKIALKRAMFSLASFLGLDKDTQIEIELPGFPRELIVPVEDAIIMAKSNSPAILDHRQKILEAERDVNKTKVESRLNANLNISVGYNQVADSFRYVYQGLLRQDLVSLTLSIPLVDWGVRKGRYNMAVNDLNVVKIAGQQAEVDLEKEVIMTVNDFNIQQNMITSAEEALELATMAYEQTRQRFIIGKADINSLTLSLNRQQEAQKNYILALQNYWLNYYKLRRLTLFDFRSGISLSERFDHRHFNSR